MVRTINDLIKEGISSAIAWLTATIFSGSVATIRVFPLTLLLVECLDLLVFHK